MNRSLAHTVFLEAAVVVAAFYLLLSVMVLFEIGGIGGGQLSAALASLAVSSAGAIILAGVWLSKQSPSLGGLLVLLGAVPLAVQMSWLLFTPILPMLIIVLLIVRAVRATRARRATS